MLVDQYSWKYMNSEGIKLKLIKRPVLSSLKAESHSRKFQFILGKHCYEMWVKRNFNVPVHNLIVAWANSLLSYNWNQFLHSSTIKNGNESKFFGYSRKMSQKKNSKINNLFNKTNTKAMTSTDRNPSYIYIYASLKNQHVILSTCEALTFDFI